MSQNEIRDRQRQNVYLAGPLFSEAERVFNARLAALLEDFTKVYLPQRDGGLMSEMMAIGVPSDVAARQVFNLDMNAIKEADYVIAILDGRAIDEGVAFELGIAFSQSKRCVGLQTDSRRLAPWGNNPMITGSLETVFMSVDELVDWLKSSIMSDYVAGTLIYRGDR
jgi:nucleoside 2-deoxyribosyltransferase